MRESNKDLKHVYCVYLLDEKERQEDEVLFHNRKLRLVTRIS